MKEHKDETPNTKNAIYFNELDWTTPAPGVRAKEAILGGERLRLVEFSEDFEEADWCRKGHIAYVIDGKIEIEFEGSIVQLKAGDGLFVPSGESSKHRARVPHGSATLFIIESAETPVR